VTGACDKAQSNAVMAKVENIRLVQTNLFLAAGSMSTYTSKHIWRLRNKKEEERQWVVSYWVVNPKGDKQ
jgi:hypothetical protein